MQNDTSNQMPKARSNGFLATLSPEKYLLIGGSDRENAFNDVWLMIPTLKKWIPTSKDNKISSLFYPRSGFAGALTNKTKEDITIYLHGGLDFFTQKFFADMLEIKIPLPTSVNDNETESSLLSQAIVKNHTVYPLDISKIPCERNSHCMCYNSKENCLYIFGGGAKEKMLNDLWSFNISTKEYTKIEIENIDNVISPRELFGMVYNEAKNTLVIFGGRLYDSIDNNSYVIDLNTKKCSIGNKMPKGICAFAFTKAIYNTKQYVVIYGGTDGKNLLNSFVVYDVENGEFKKSKLIINKDLVNNDPTYAVFLGRISAMMTFDEDKGNIVLYGGSASDKEWSYINVISMKDIMDALQ